MPALSNLGVALAVGAVAVVLVLGLVNMLRQGSANTSQTLMRAGIRLDSPRCRAPRKWDGEA